MVLNLINFAYGPILHVSAIDSNVKRWNKRQAVVLEKPRRLIDIAGQIERATILFALISQQRAIASWLLKSCRTRGGH